MKNVFILYVFLFFIQNAPSISILSQSSGYKCLKTTQVTVFAASFLPRNYWNQIHELMDFLMEDSPCLELFVFVNCIRRSVPWNKFKANSFDVIKILSDKEILALIQDEFHVEENRPKTFDTNKEQTVLFFKNYWKDADNIMLEALEILDNKVAWNVIIGCSSAFGPISQKLPIQRIVAEWDLSLQPKTFIDLVRNPNFNKFKYLKNVKLDDERLNCLTNKSIHIIEPSYSIALLESIALILFNTDQLQNTKFFLYKEFRDNRHRKFMEHFLQNNGFFSNKDDSNKNNNNDDDSSSNNKRKTNNKDNKFNLVYDIRERYKRSLMADTDDVYMIFDTYVLSEVCHDPSFLIRGQKSFVFNYGVGMIQKACLEKFHKVMVKESGSFIYDRQSYLKHIHYRQATQFMEDLLNASCF